MRRRSVDLPDEHVAALEAASEQDQVSVSTRLAALVQLWVTDSETRRRSAAISAEISAEKRRRKQAAAMAAGQHRWAKGRDSID